MSEELVVEELGIDELRQAVREVLTDRNSEAIEIPDEEGRGLDRALWTEMANLGWLALPVAEEFGGLGLGPAHLAVLYEELGRQMASVPILPTMLAAAAIARHGSRDVQARWLSAIAGGDCIAAIAFPGEGEGASMGADGTVSGTVENVLFADVADLLLFPVSGESGVTSLAIVPRVTPGVEVVPRTLFDLTRSMAQVRLDRVAVADIELLEIGEPGWSALFDHAAMGLACDAIGGADALLGRTVEYLKIREQFGRPIGSFQAIKHRMADWKVGIEAARMLARHCAAAISDGQDSASQTASGAKAYACDTYAAFAGDAVQLHGGIGFTWEHPCHLFLKRAKLNQQLFGGGKLHKERVARLAFG